MPIAEGKMENADTLSYPSSSAPRRVFNIVELLEEIFMYRVLDDRQIPSPGGAPLLLAHVNRQWRSVALNSPKLWSRLHLVFDERICSNQQLLEGYLSVLSFWMAQSRPLPIDLHIDVQKFFGVKEMDSGSSKWKHRPNVTN